MKIALVAIIALASSIASASPDLIERIVGKYNSIDSNCAYDTAKIKISRLNDSRILQIRLSNSNTKAFNVHSMDLDNLWTKVRTTRGFQRIIRQDRIQGQTLLAEEKECVPGWLVCKDWVTKAEVTLLNDDTIEARLSEDEMPCSYRRVEK